MTELTLASLHPQHFADQEMHRVSRMYNLHGSFFLNLPHISRSPELSRAYQFGDPVRLIDWKAYARNDQLIVREERDEAMASVVVVLDGRKSMQWPDRAIEEETREQELRKFAFASRVALHLVHRHVRSGDRVRLVMLSDTQEEYKDALSIELRTIADVLSLFEEMQTQGFTVSCLESFLNLQNILYSKTHVLYWVSDACTGLLPIETFTRAQQTVFFHTLSSRECDPSWLRDKSCYFDSFIKHKEYLGSLLKKKDLYHEKIKSWREGLQRSIESHHGYYMLFTEKSSIRSYIAGLDALRSS
jgi:hypothetical protein